MSLEGLGASAQDIEALRRTRALDADKAVAVQQAREARPSTSQVKARQQRGMAAAATVANDLESNIRQPDLYFALLQGQLADATS